MFDSLFTMMGIAPDELNKMQSQFETLLTLPQKMDELISEVNEIKRMIEDAKKKKKKNYSKKFARKRE